MIEEKSCEDFINTGLLLYINQILHVFGWAIVYNLDNKTIFPARVKFRGFDNKNVSTSYIKISQYMVENASVLLEEAKE